MRTTPKAKAYAIINYYQRQKNFNCHRVRVVLKRDYVIVYINNYRFVCSRDKLTY